MKLSLCNEVVRELDFIAQCQLAKELGYDGLELAPFTLGDEPHRLPAERRSAIRRIAEDHGLAITGLHWLLVAPEGLSITSPEEAVRERTLGVMRGLIELCRELGGSVLVHGSPAQRAIHEGETHDVAVSRAHDAFALVADDAAAAGVTYCIEALAPAETPVINTVEQAASIARTIGSPGLKTMVDTCAAAQNESLPVPELLAKWVPTGMIAHVHLNDPNRRAPGQGSLRFGPVLEALRASGYAGVCSIEPFVYEPDGPTTAARAIGYLEGLLERD